MPSDPIFVYCNASVFYFIKKFSTYSFIFLLIPIRDYTDHNRQKIMTLKAAEFIRRFQLHVLPPRYVRIRHFGLLANRKCWERTGIYFIHSWNIENIQSVISVVSFISITGYVQICYNSLFNILISIASSCTVINLPCSPNL